jgi:uncharacterized protein (DUF302 family)
MKYYIQARTRLGFEDAIARVIELLKEEGFGVLTEIDVQATLKRKLDMDYKPYRILGACNPSFAHQALNVEPLIGVFLPCNVVVWDDGDDRVVAAMEPIIMAEIIGNPAVSVKSVRARFEPDQTGVKRDI